MLIDLSPILNRSFYKYLIPVLVLLFCMTPRAFADTESCDRSFLQPVLQREVVKSHVPTLYTTPILPSGATIETRIEQQNNILFSTKESSFTYAFPISGAYTLVQQIILSPACTTWISYAIHAYDRILTYLGESIPDMEIMKPELAKQGIWILQRSVENDAWKNLFATEAYLLTDADIILIHTPSLGSIFDAIPLSVSDKVIYTTAPISQSTFRRIASRYQTTLGITHLSVIQPSHINILFSALAFGKPLEDLDVVHTFSVTANDQVRQSPVSYAIDYLLYTGFPLSLLTWMLLLPCLALLLAALRQIIGLSVFGIFNPLLLWVALHIAGIRPTLIMLWCWVIATLMVRGFTKKIFLLYSAKVALTLTLYMLWVIFAFALYAYMRQATDTVPMQWDFIASPSGIFCCIYLLLIARQIFSPKTSFQESWWWLGLLEFIVISACIYWLIDSIWLQNILLWYPEITIGFILLSIIIGRFSGLQLIEYVRFMPLIKYHMTKK